MPLIPATVVSDDKKALKNVYINNINRFLFGHLRFNSLQNKFDLLWEQIKGLIYIFMIFGSNLNDTLKVSS